MIAKTKRDQTPSILRQFEEGYPILGRSVLSRCRNTVWRQIWMEHWTVPTTMVFPYIILGIVLPIHIPDTKVSSRNFIAIECCGWCLRVAGDALFPAILVLCNPNGATKYGIMPQKMDAWCRTPAEPRIVASAAETFMNEAHEIQSFLN